MGGKAKNVSKLEKGEKKMHFEMPGMGKIGPRGRARAPCPGLVRDTPAAVPSSAELSTPLSPLITGLTSRINSSTYFPILFAATER